jgi:hypothetical protein
MQCAGARGPIAWAIALGVFVAFPAGAATVSTSGAFFDTVPTAGEPVTNINTNTVTSPAFASGAAFLNWGTPNTGSAPNNQSGLVFEGVTVLDVGALSGITTFGIGTLYHRNNEILTDGISATKLRVKINIQNSTTINEEVVFGFDILETLNNPAGGVCEAGGVPPLCPDRVKFTNAGFSDRPIRVDGKDYFVQLVGFQEPGSNSAVKEFLTVENSVNNQASLTARFTPDNTQVVPVPASLWMLLTALGSLGIVARWRR